MKSHKLKNNRNLKDDFCATKKLKNPFKIMCDSIASNKSHVSGNDEIGHFPFNDTLTNGCFDLNFSEGSDGDISMTCDFAPDHMNNQSMNQAALMDTKSIASCNH